MKSFAVLLSGLGLAALVLASCSSSSHSATSSSSSSSASSSSNSGGMPLKIGIVCSCSTALASTNGIAVTGIKAWAASVNAHGGVNGHQVDLVIENDSASAGTSISEVQSLINQDHVVAIGQISDVDSSWASYASQAHIPVIGLGSEDTNDFTNPNFFSPGLTNDAGPAALVEAMKLMHVTKLGLMYCVEAAICSAGIPSEKQYAKAHGIQVAYVTGISGSAPNYVAQCLAAKQAGVQALAIGTGNSEIQSVAASCAMQGYNPIELQEDPALGFANLPGLKNNIIADSPVIPYTANTPGVKSMTAAFNKYAPGTLTDPNFNVLGEEGYITGLLIQAAASAGQVGVNGPPTSQELYNGLYSLHGDTLGGMAPPLTFQPGKPNPVECWYWVADRNGKWVTPYGLTPVCAAKS